MKELIGEEMEGRRSEFDKDGKREKGKRASYRTANSSFNFYEEVVSVFGGSRVKYYARMIRRKKGRNVRRSK